MRSPISKTRFVAASIIAATIAITISAAALSADVKPNVILIFADDLGYGDVGCSGEACPFETPNLDRMAAEGARLTSFYPTCAPTTSTRS